MYDKLQWLIPTMKPYSVQTAFMEACSHEIFVKKAKGYGNFKEPGLGKTADAYNVFLNLLALPSWHPSHVDKLVVFMPNFGKGNWGYLLSKDMNIFEPTCLSPEVPLSSHRVWEINYDISRFSLFDDIQNYMIRHKCMFVADESHNIKDWKGKTSTAIVKLAKNAVFSMPMTGTPYGENPLELWTQLRAARRISGINPITFRNTWAIMGGFRGKKIVGIKDPPAFTKFLNENAFIASADDWLDLPERVYNIARGTMTPKQQEMYNTMYKDRFLPAVEGAVRGDVSAQMVITMMIKLQQITSGYIIDDERLVTEIMPKDQNPRIKVVKEICQNRGGKKIIFTTSKYSALALAEMLPNSIVLKAGMKPHETAEVKDRFNSNGGPVHFIAPEQLAKEQITLLGGTDKRWACFTTIYFENLYSLIARRQSEDRNRRIGQHFPVGYFDISMSPNDDTQLESLQAKKAVVKSVIRRITGQDVAIADPID